MSAADAPLIDVSVCFRDAAAVKRRHTAPHHQRFNGLPCFRTFSAQSMNGSSGPFVFAVLELLVAV